MSRLVLSPRVRDDLEAIWSYSVNLWGEEQAARYILEIRDLCTALAEGRRRGRPCDEIRPGYRRLSIGAHLLFYRTEPDGTIDVVRILHQSMDIALHLAA
ncbi:type II toxin-antitoxin system RelE/ParE family toxin [Ancylobacter lacus]|uniref:type II toxin-antitoxin system RelE/ParE family toxin n=1 Tax=Ancylobacter lacus TaxID=2579970 RepID=UPI001BCEB3BB|nr:type II toxin-antitoxin system RelE/ParE family toxin [Ancylobacter lacus]MBS7537760.1 type II toxin-antitoxin system RelE/ParE family toxin [Ancylobacter lacus]